MEAETQVVVRITEVALRKPWPLAIAHLFFSFCTLWAVIALKWGRGSKDDLMKEGLLLKEWSLTTQVAISWALARNAEAQAAFRNH